MISYSTIVSELIYNPVKRTYTLKIHGWYSTTTARHISAFIAWCGFDLNLYADYHESDSWKEFLNSKPELVRTV